MTLFDIIRNLQAIAAQEPSVKSVSDGDIYDALNAAVDIKYGVFHITQDTHTTNGDLDVWGLNLFYIDRLLDNGENRLSIQSAGITILENVLRNFADTFGAEYMNNIVYTPFTQRFKDNCAGVFCKISVSTVMDNLCAEGGKIVLVKNQDKSIDITSNGRYNVTPDYGYSGLGSVDINVDVQGGEPLPPIEPVLQEKSIDIAENGNYSVSPDAGVDGLNRVDITVNVPSTSEPKLQSKKYDITEDGTYTVLPDEGYDGLERVDIFAYTGSRCDSEETYRTYTRNGTYEITPSNPDYFIRKANVTVNVPSTPYVVPDKMRFQNSTFSAFPAEGLDFSQKTDFQSCWYNCYNLSSFPIIDTSNGTNFYFTWGYCKFTEFPMLNMSNGTNFSGTWIYCSAMTTMPMLDLSSGTDFGDAWNLCNHLTNLGGFGAIKASIDLSASNLLTVDSMMNIINQAADLNILGITGKTMKFGSTNLAKLTDAQKAVATNKGWTLS